MPKWFLPLVYTVVALVAAYTVPRIEHALGLQLGTGLTDAAMLSALSAIASGTMALTAIVFSIAFVMVQFSAVTYSPRIALRFANDPLLYHALGIFSATFIYAIATIAWVGRDGAQHLPELSWFISVSLVIASFLVFARLVQRLSDLQVTNTLRQIGDNGRAVIAQTFRARSVSPPRVAEGAHAPVTQVLRFQGAPQTVQLIAHDRLVATAAKQDAVIVLACAVGDTLADGAVILTVHGGNPIAEAELRRAVVLGYERTYAQDPKYPIRLLVDVAIKALSPAINDPTTAVQAIDQIEDLLRRIAHHDLDVGRFADAGGRLRLVVPMPSWDDYLGLALDEIRMFGATSIQVMRRLRHTLIGLREELGDHPRAGSVLRYMRHLDQSIAQSPLDAEDRNAARMDDPQGLGLTRGGPA